MSYSIKTRREILSDVIHEANEFPTDWKAVFGRDIKRLSTDYYLFHPDVGLYLLKEYEKNPLERLGVGSKIARYVDDDIRKTISTLEDNFGIIQGDFSKIFRSIQQGIHPTEIVHAAFRGKDLGLSIPLRGGVTSQTDTYLSLRSFKEKSQKKIDEQFEKLASENKVYNSYE